ncbi:hypothetical protein Avbf_10425 [Armadillidium vulgare]|nr:hypothetical protein Avbf_10425 [Armadillidium vulgare]
MLEVLIAIVSMFSDNPIKSKSVRWLYAHEVVEEEFAQELLNCNPGSSIITKLDSLGYRYQSSEHVLIKCKRFRKPFSNFNVVKNINNYAHEVTEEEFAQELLNSNPGSSIITKLDSHVPDSEHDLISNANVFVNQYFPLSKL